MRARRGPRSASQAIRALRVDSAPATLLAAVQSVWVEAMGAGIAAAAEPVAEREGVVTVACRTAAWAHELDLLQGELVDRLNRALETAPASPQQPVVHALRATAAWTRFFG